jgi:hypothetical protein
MPPARMARMDSSWSGVQSWPLQDRQAGRQAAGLGWNQSYKVLESVGVGGSY